MSTGRAVRRELVVSLAKVAFLLEESAPIFQALRNPDLQGRCGTCEYAELCGGCRARAFAMTGDFLAEDPWCPYVPGTDQPLPLPQSEDVVAWTPDAKARLKKAPFSFGG